LTCNSAFLTHVKNKQSLRQSEERTKQYNDNSLPFCGSVTERKTHAVLHKSKTQPNIKDFDKKCSSNNLPHHDNNSSSNTNDMNLQESSGDLSRIIPSPLKFSNGNKTDFKKQFVTDKVKPEETVYDADTELTAGDADELLRVTMKVKDKLHQNKSSNVNSDKMSANLRKVQHSKKDKEKIKSKTKVSSNLYAEERYSLADNSEVSKTTDSQIQLFQNQTEHVPTGNSVGKQSLLNTSKYYQAQNCPSKAEDTRGIYQVNLMTPRNQETNKETSSEMSEDMESKIQKTDSNSSINKIPPEFSCAENLPFQDNTSNVLSLQLDFLHTNEKHRKLKINRKTFQNPSKMYTAKYCREENGPYGEHISKKSQKYADMTARENKTGRILQRENTTKKVVTDKVEKLKGTAFIKLLRK